MSFVSMTSPPAQTPPGAVWYLVRASELLVGPDGLPAGPGAVPPAALAPLLEQADTEAVFLGVDRGRACWAQGLPSGSEPPEGSRWVGLLALGSSLPAPDWAVAGRAVQLVEWLRTSRFCGRCASATELVTTDRAARCPSCGLLAYPRLSPAVIVVVRRGRSALLARNAGFRGRMFSALAGFVEPGETLEQAARREVGEEVGVTVGALRYVGSQPWPFPHSLMVGFLGEWAAGEIAVDGDEIVEAGWFEPEALPELPPRLSIARTLVEEWLAQA
jgi:NAD+ diphosphatase